ncbi:tudor domain-containing protein 15 isoform X2 [Pangasianodon hypophthalmus]|uniref:tudor domain-containing protein 15 isoform X2 n=1 Tax=Pangasianodon hypophthalmus TaxID=310915 RepID=UPI002307E7E7|nr:tudor domain-containing protein 15 isoform X2 [Pangasianodon hypophthalmus]
MDWKQTDRSREDSKHPAPCALWPVDLKLTHTDCNPGNTLVHFQGQYATICELDYNILQVEIQNVPKTTVSMEVGDLCLVEDLLSSRWYRGRVQNKSGDLFDVFLLDHGNILTVGPNHLSTISDSLLMLPPKIVCGFIANVLPVQECWDQPSEAYFSSLIGRQIKGYIHGLLPYKVLILEVPEITKDLIRLSLGRHVDTDTFLLLVELVIEVPIQQSCESVPDLLIEKQIAHEISFKSSNLCGYENILSLSGPKLVVGQKERVRIAAAVNPGLFYCQLSSAAKDLKEMSEKLALVCESRNGDFRDSPGENMGLLCAIKGKDEKWHRGFVQCLPVNSQVRVVFVDYGYCESVKVENIIQLPSDFLLRPVMTFPCSLSCLGGKDKATVNQQLVLLRKGLLGKELVITVDDLSKEKNVCSVMLSKVVECALIRTVQSKEVDKMTSTGILPNVHRLCYIPNETKKVGISKNLVAFEHIQDGSVFQGYVEHVQSPHDFWMRTSKSNDRFEAMMNRLTNWFSRLQLNEETLQDPVPGQLCCAMYEKDMHYYRALVVDILEYGAEVFFIDFGNTEKVPSMLIKKIPTEFTVEPEFAFNCSLAHVVPLEDVWTAAATDFFRNATSNKALLVDVIYRKSDVFVVELYEKGFEKSESITTLLTSANMAEYWTYSVIKTPGTPVEKNNKTGKTGKTFVRGRFPENSCKSVSQKLPSKVIRQEIATDKQIHPETQKCSAEEIFKGQKLKPGAVISVQCSHVGSPSDFWCQNKKNKKDLDRLMEGLQMFYTTNNSVLQPHSVCCAVRFHLDNKWYRGCILGGTDLNVKVILVDYGMVVQENLQNLQALNPEFLELEGQAFRCSLYNLIDPVGGHVWTDEASTLFKDFTSGSSCNLRCKIYSQVYVAKKGLCNVVDLYTPLQRASTHLIERGVAKEIQCPNQLPPSVYPCTFVYSSFGITLGSEELVFPTHVVSPWEIYLQLDRNTEIIEQLMDRAMKLSEELMSQMHTGKTGSVCLAKYSEDGKWYRSFVWPAQSSLHFNVFFVDYGTKQVAEKKNVLSIPIKAVDLLLTPMQALRCSLLSIPEEEHLPKVNTWLEKATLNKGLRAKFVATNSSGHFICDLFDGEIHINEKVREIIAIHGQKSKSVRKPMSDCCKEVVNISSGGNKFKSKGKHAESVVKSQRTPGRTKVIQGNGQSCQKKSSKLKSPQKSHSLNGSPAKNGQGKEKHSLKPTKQLQKEKHCTIPSTSNLQPSKVLPKVSDLPAIKITPGFRSMGFISHYDSIDSFFIQMEKDEKKILKMREELNSSPFIESLQSVTSSVKVGDLVAARYDEDLALYRAAVNSLASSGYLTVEFVDYGNTATVDKKKIHPLASKFMSEARLSAHCKLSKPYNLEDVESFLSDTHDKPLMVEFVQNLGYAWEVSIQGLAPSNESRESDPAGGTEDKVPDSGQAKQRQELYAAVHEDDTALTSICEKTEADTASIIEQAKKSESGTKDSKMVQEKTLEKVQATRATGGMQKLRTKRKACAYKCKCDEKQDVCQSDLPQKPEINISVAENELLNISNNSCGWSGSNTLKTSVELPESVGVDGQDISVKKCPSVVHQPTPEGDCPAPFAIPPEKPIDKEDEIQHLFLAPVKKDHEYSGFAAAVTTPGEFYIVLEDLLLIMNAVSNILEDLPEDLAPLPEAHLIPGTGCLVKSEEKKKWCRAEIIQCNDISVIINLVDYGYCVHLACQDVCNLKALPVELAGLPKITYPCLLRGIKPADELQWSDNAAMFFQQCMYQKNLKIHFRQYVSDAQWEVDVVTSNRNVAKELVDAGHAHYIDTVLGIRFQQGLGHKWEIKSNSVENVSEAVSGKHEQTPSNMEKVPHRYLEDVSSNDDEEISEGCSTEGETEDPFSGRSDKHGSAQKKKSRLSQFM